MKKNRYIKIGITFIVLLCASFFLFLNLGHYALWDDEAICALFAQSLWQTGDTNAILDHNIIAFNSGIELDNLKMRYIPPLQFYIAAPFVGLSHGSTLMARFPFALCGVLTIIIILIWLWQSKEKINTWILLSMGVLTNTSLMLFFRQCRYYSLSIFTTTLLAFLYFKRSDDKKILTAISFVALLLLASNYLCFVSALACLMMDYFLWGRKKKPLKLSSMAIIFIPLIILGGLLVKTYNPLGKNIWGLKTTSLFKYKVSLFLWNLRELNSAEMGVGVFILLAPFLYYLQRKDQRLLQCPTAIFVYCLMTTIFSPQPEGLLSIAVIRYLAPIIPLCIFTAVLTIENITLKKKWLAIPLAVLAFGTNALHGGPLVGVHKKTCFTNVLPDGRLRSSIFEFIKEINTPNQSAYRATANWINQNLKDKESIWVLPGYAAYPLMFHAPKATYAWQLNEASDQFENLDSIHFKGVIAPEYIIAFGQSIYPINETLGELKKTRGILYEKIKMIDIYWHDLTRPELFWHSFQEITNYSKESQAIYIFKLKKQK